MSTSTSLPGRLRLPIPENGYESPRSPENENIFLGNGTNNDTERRRAGFTGGSDDIYAGAGSPESQRNLRRDPADSGREEEAERKIGFRDRIGCHTWTWFTMTMATGGIANVLHSSKKPDKPSAAFFLIDCSSLPVRLAGDCRSNIFLVQSCSIYNELLLHHITFQMESGVITRLLYEFLGITLRARLRKTFSGCLGSSLLIVYRLSRECLLPIYIMQDNANVQIAWGRSS